MKNKVILCLSCCFIILFLCGCNNKEEQIIEEIPFQLSCTDNYQYNDNVMVEVKDNISTIILPINSRFLDDDYFIFDSLYCYDVDTKQKVEDLTIDKSELQKDKVGTYTLKLSGKYDNKVGSTDIKIKLGEACSGNCTITTSKWTFKITDNIVFTQQSEDYSTLNLQVEPRPINEHHAYYSTTFDGQINLRYLTKNFYSKKVASDINENGEKDNAINLGKIHYRDQSRNETLYLKFRVLPNNVRDEEAFIDFYDKVEDEHHFYYLSK